jgi:hypothetical protein
LIRERYGVVFDVYSDELIPGWAVWKIIETLRFWVTIRSRLQAEDEMDCFTRMDLRDRLSKSHGGSFYFSCFYFRGFEGMNIRNIELGDNIILKRFFHSVKPVEVLTFKQANQGKLDISSLHISEKYMFQPALITG